MTSPVPLEYGRPSRRPDDRRSLIWIAVVVAGVALLVVGVSLSCDPFGVRGELVSGRIGGSRVWLGEGGGFVSSLRLYVKRGGQTRFEYVIDKSDYSTLRLIKQNGRLLVANGDYIFAAYDPAADTIIHYRDLPVTIWNRKGEVIDKYKWSDGPARMRRDFPERREK